jgi:hypothetical protein
MISGLVFEVFKRGAALLNSLPPAQWLLADRGYDADWFREGMKTRA